MTTKDTQDYQPDAPVVNPYAGKPLEPTESQVVFSAVTEEPLEPLLAEAKEVTMTRSLGALVVFDGIVRDHDHGQAVRSLSYSAHPQAAEFLAGVLTQVTQEIPGIRLWAAHRVGPIPIGQSALTVLVAAAHRETAFAACSLVADRIKTQVPIWKEQELTNGSVQWVGIDTPTQ